MIKVLTRLVLGTADLVLDQLEGLRKLQLWSGGVRGRSEASQRRGSGAAAKFLRGDDARGSSDGAVSVFGRGRGRNRRRRAPGRRRHGGGVAGGVGARACFGVSLGEEIGRAHV